MLLGHRDVLVGAKRSVRDPETLVPPRGEETRALGIDEADRCITEGRYADAIAFVDDALATRSNDRELLTARARVLHHWGRHKEARDLLLDVELGGANAPAFYHMLGLACFWSGDLPGAERWMRVAVTQDPENWEHFFGLGIVLYGRQEYSDAGKMFEQALALEPDNAYCLANLISCEIDSRDLLRAERLARRMVEVHPNNFVSWSNLGVVLDRFARYDEAIVAFEKATQTAVAAGCVWDSDFVNHAICLLRASRTQAALNVLETRLSKNPVVQAHCHYSLGLLASGRMKEGWDQFEFRWIEGPLRSARPNFVKPHWIGQDLADKTILIRSEQGYGDFFQFMRYLPHIKALGAHVLLTVHEHLRAIACTAEGVDEVLRPHQPYPNFDYYADLLSLPRIFGTDLSNIPSEAPYLQVDPARRAVWVERIRTSSSLKVGLAWAGSPTHMRDTDRSIALDVMKPLESVKKVTFYSLQKGPPAAQARINGHEISIVDLESELIDFADTAALIDVLDLIICVDTSVAHLAGALGKPVWVMLPKFSDWRWLEGRTDSPWYPSMKLFRQSKHGEWTNVVHDIAVELGRVIDGEIDLPAPAMRARHTTTPLVPRVPELPNSRLSAATRTRDGYFQFFPADEIVSRSITFYGEYLPRQLILLARILTPTATIVETGSGIGLHAVALARKVTSEAHLLLYESRPLFRKVLSQNLSANGIANVTIMKTDLCGCNNEDAKESVAEVAQRNVDTIDALRLDKLHLLKIFENCEPLTIIEGASDTIWRERPYLFSAVDDLAASVQFAERMTAFGYRSWRMETPFYDPANFNGQRQDIFSGRLAVAVLAIPEEIDVDITLTDCIEIV
jgi:Flp pilus assembly protein TadD